MINYRYKFTGFTTVIWLLKPRMRGELPCFMLFVDNVNKISV